MRKRYGRAKGRSVRGRRRTGRKSRTSRNPNRRNRVPGNSLKVGYRL